jgi:preprotein translocase subunit SecB
LNETSKVPVAGFALHRVYFLEQVLRLVQATPEMPEVEGPISFGWDWRVTGPRDFEVILQVSVGPSRARPEDASVALSGSFSVSGPNHSVATLEFVRIQGPAILFPYLREGLSAITSRGAHGPSYLAPMNVHALMQNFDPEKATGALQLKSGSEPAFLEA